jgi:hypothetical protein
MLPSALFALTRDHGARGEDFASLRLCRAAGDCVSAELEREFTGLTGIVIDEAYGLTEVGLAAVSPPTCVGGAFGVEQPGAALVIAKVIGEPATVVAVELPLDDFHDAGHRPRIGPSAGADHRSSIVNPCVSSHVRSNANGSMGRAEPRRATSKISSGRRTSCDST